MKTIRTKVYQFSELSKSAQETAKEWWKDMLNEDSYILDGFSEYCTERAKEEGFEDIELQYSLSYSQGDGLSFSGKLDTNKFLSENIRPLFTKVLSNNLTVEINGNTGRYCYASTSDIDMYLEYGKEYANIQNIIDELKGILENKYITLCKELEKTGYKWIESRYEDENVIADIEANEYYFTKDGKIFNK